MVTTFLPHEGFEQSVKALDLVRLLNQRKETYQILDTLLKPGTGWLYHPAALMWVGHESWLLKYQEATCAEAVNRGHSDGWWWRTCDLWDQHPMREDARPPWLGLDIFHESMRSVLLEKAQYETESKIEWFRRTEPAYGRDYYDEFIPTTRDRLGYFWPRTSNKKVIVDHIDGTVLATNYEGGRF